MDILKTLAEEFNLKEEQVSNTVALIDEGNTIPFISRYRKEVTGSLDDATLRDLFDRLTYLRKMDERRAEISNLIDGQGKLTPEITAALDRAELAKFRYALATVSSDLSLKHNVTVSLTVKPHDDFMLYSTTLPFYTNVIKEGIRYGA